MIPEGEAIFLLRIYAALLVLAGAQAVLIVVHFVAPEALPWYVDTAPALLIVAVGLVTALYFWITIWLTRSR